MNRIYFLLLLLQRITCVTPTHSISEIFDKCYFFSQIGIDFHFTHSNTGCDEYKCKMKNKRYIYNTHLSMRTRYIYVFITALSSASFACSEGAYVRARTHCIDKCKRVYAGNWKFSYDIHHIHIIHTLFSLPYKW